MAQNKKCVLCGRTIAEESPAILTVGAYGNTKCICSCCQELLDTATLGKEYEEIADAMEKIGKIMADSTPDNQCYEVVSALLSDAAERAKKIKAGEYDFSLDEESEDDGELPEELIETEEDKAKDARDAEKERKFNKVFNIVSAIAFSALAIYFIVELIVLFLE